MAITVMNSAGEIEQATTGKAPDRPEVDYVRNEKGQFAPADASASAEKPANGSAKAEDAKSQAELEWYERHQVTPELRSEVESLIKRAVNKKHAQAKTSEEFAQAKYEELKAAEARAEALTRENQRLKAEADAAKPKDDNKEPQREKYESDKAYADALIDWRVDQKLKAREVADAKKVEEDRRAAVMKAAEARVAKAREIVPDFQEVMEAADFTVPAHIAEYMQESELFTELGYHFAKHPDDLRQLSAMPVRTYGDVQRLGVAISKIEGKLKPFASEPAKQTQAKVDTDGDEPSDSSNGVEPSEDTGSIPSIQSRVAAPVIKPLNVGSTSLVEKPASKRTYEEDRAAYEKVHKRNFSNRARH